MKKIFSIILLVILCKNSDAQIFKSFDCVKSYEDSLISVYSVRIKLEQQLDNNRRLNIVRTELKKHFQIQSDMILQIETLGSKKYRTYQYRVVVAKKNITDTLKYFDNMGKDNSPFLNDYEAEYFNLRFQGIDFDFTDKKVFFFGPEGLVFSDKQRYFDEFTRHTFIQSSLYIFDKLEKERSGGFDAVIVYWSKRNYTKDDIIKRLKEKNSMRSGIGSYDITNDKWDGIWNWGENSTLENISSCGIWTPALCYLIDIQSIRYSY